MSLFTSLWLLGAALALIIILPPYIVYITLRHFLVGPSHPAWGWLTELSCSCGRLYFAMVTAPDAPLVHPKEPTTLFGRAAQAAPDWPDSAWKQRRLTKWIMGKGTRVDMARLPPAPAGWLVGMAAHASDAVKAVEVPGFWVSCQDDGPPVGRAHDGQKVIVYWPGDGVHPLTSPVAYGLAQTTGLRVLAAAYRTVASNASAFPAQMLDALAAYAHLRDIGFTPENILVVAESAGAFFSLAMMRHLGELRTDHGIDAGMPGAAVLMSPACNMSRFDHPKVVTDYRLPHYRRRTVPALARHFNLDSLCDSLYFSPALGKTGSFTHLMSTSIWIQFGSGELFADDIRKLIEAMRADGVNVTADEIWGGLHTDATIRRSFGARKGSWEQMLAAVDRCGWTRAGGVRTLSEIRE